MCANPKHCISSLFYFAVLFCQSNGEFFGGDIYNHLLGGHNPLIPPANDNISVGVGLDLLGIYGIDMKNEIMTVRVNLDLYWNDSTLRWSQKQHPHVNSISMSSSKIWTPKIQLWNSAENMEFTSKGDIFIAPNGELYWTVLVTFKSKCQMDASYFPFDSQTCILKFGPVDDIIRIELYKNISWIGLASYYRSSSWWVVETQAYNTEYYVFEADELPTTAVIFTLTVQRRTNWISQVYPSLVLGFLIIVPCALSLNHFFEKILIQLVCLAGLFALFVDTAKVLPPTVYESPHVIKYMTSLVVINLVHLTLTCILKTFGRWPSKLAKHVPNWVVGIIDRILCVTEASAVKNPDNQEIELQANNDIKTGKKLITLLNIFVFVAIFLAVLISTLCLLLSYPTPIVNNDEAELEVIELYT